MFVKCKPKKGSHDNNDENYFSNNRDYGEEVADDEYYDHVDHNKLKLIMRRNPLWRTECSTRTVLDHRKKYASNQTLRRKGANKNNIIIVYIMLAISKI